MYESENYVCNRIAVYKTDKRLIELRDKLNASIFGNYAELHGHTDIVPQTGEVIKTYSNIGVILQDYSNGTGDKLIKVSVNISPEDIFWIHNALMTGKQSFELEQTKIFGYPDNRGYSKMTKIRIVRSECDNQGNLRRYQWSISGENGEGIAQKTQLGGTYCKSGTYRALKKAYINLNDYDFFKIIDRTARYIRQFENAYVPEVIRQGRQAYEAMIESKRNE